MIAASKAGLAYYETNFSPFQFRQYRVLEFPRYRTFAQSFPNTIPFSEGIGFIGRLEKPTDIDFTYFVYSARARPPVVGPSTHRRTCRRLEHALGNPR